MAIVVVVAVAVVAVSLIVVIVTVVVVAVVYYFGSRFSCLCAVFCFAYIIVVLCCLAAYEIFN